jgi:hypothetical protein
MRLERSRDRRAGTVADLKDRCRRLQRTLEARRLATSEELNDWWPGGGQNDDTGHWGWILCFANYLRFYGRDEDTPQKRAARTKALAESARAEPAPVRLVSGEQVAVYPKSYVALRFLDSLKANILSLLELQRALFEERADDALSVAAAVPLAESFGTQVWAWIITHPEAGLPFAAVGDAPDPPSWTSSLMPQDLIALAGAHLRVNRTNLDLTAELNPDGGQRSSLPIEGWVSAYAAEKGHPTTDVLERWPLGMVIAQAVASGISYHEARERAETSAGATR